jgi:hypothetical protein
MIKKFVILLAGIATVFMSFMFVISPYESSIALRRKTAAIFYEYGFDQAARKVWELSAWAGDRGAEANLALLDYQTYNLHRFRNPDNEEDTWHKGYVLVDRLLSSISSERDVHDFNRALLRLSWPTYPEWMQSAVTQIKSAQASGSEVARQVLTAYEKHRQHKDIYRVLADNGDMVAAYHVANQIHFTSEKDEYKKYFEIAKSGSAKYFAGYDFVRPEEYIYSPEVDLFETYAHQGYIKAKSMLVGIFSERFFAGCHFWERFRCEVEDQKKANILMEEIINHDCSQESAKFRLNEQGLIILNLFDGPILYKCLNNQIETALLLAGRLHLGIGAEQDKAKAKSILEMKFLSKQPYAQMLLARLNLNRNKSIEETLKIESYFTLTPDMVAGESKRLVKAGTIRPVTFLDFEDWATKFNDEDIDRLWSSDNFDVGNGYLWTIENIEADGETILANTQRKFVAEASPETQRLAKKWPDRLFLLRRKAS